MVFPEAGKLRATARLNGADLLSWFRFSTLIEVEEVVSSFEIPSCVTRFYGSTTYARDVIENKRIAFIHASMLNDPFDPYCFFETDFEASYQNLLLHVRNRHPGDLPWFRAHVTPQSWGATVRELESHLQKVRQTSFILSTSAPLPNRHPKDNLYMWGHYGRGHRGIAMEYDTEALAKAVLAHHEAENGKPLEETSVWAKIEYVTTFSPIAAEHVYEFMKQERDVASGRIATRVMTQLDLYYSRMSIVKGDVWQSENEWRLMWRNEEAGRTIYKCPISSDCITAIYLGLSIAQEDEEAVVSGARLNFPDAVIMKAAKRHGDLALEFKTL